MSIDPVPVRPLRQVRAIGAAIAGWGTATGAGSRRPELPWRATRDPWAVLVSEIMAQQTSLERVVPAYARFMASFPTPRSCAGSPLGEVMRAWKGLGYNRRARDLHRAAIAVVAGNGGRVPSDLESLMALPGVGPYTARAVMAFAFEADVGVIDTNAGRVVARAVAGNRIGTRQAQRLVDAMVPPGQGWEFGQALLDLGAAVCAPREPSCRRCPIRRRCRWAAAGRPLPDPARGSAGVSTPQSRFEGSDRQGRGRLVDALRLGSVRPDRVAAVAGWPDDVARAQRIAEGLVADGLALWDRSGNLRLP